MQKNFLFITIISIFFFACTPIAQQRAADTLNNAADSALRISVYGTCDGAQVGAIRRWIGDDKEKIDAWQRLCEQAGQPVIP